VSSEEKRSSEKPAGEQQQKLDLYVIARIIIVLKEKGAINRTNLATLTGLAYDKLAKYLAWMNDKKLISSSEESVISLTEEGMKSYEELVEWIMRYIGRVRFPKIS
jgi:predicted transcriptional regulator